MTKTFVSIEVIHREFKKVEYNTVFSTGGMFDTGEYTTIETELPREDYLDLITDPVKMTSLARKLLNSKLKDEGKTIPSSFGSASNWSCSRFCNQPDKLERYYYFAHTPDYDKGIMTNCMDIECVVSLKN